MFEQEITRGPGTGTFTEHTFEILLMLLGAFLLGLWLGWMLWNRYKQEADKLRLDVQSLTMTVSALNTEISGLKSKLATSETNNISLRAQVDKLTEDNRIFKDQLSEASEDLAETEQRNRKLETELGLSFAPDTATPETVPLEISVIADKPAEVSEAALAQDVTAPVAETLLAPVVEVAVEPPLAEPLVLKEKPKKTETATPPAAEVVAPAMPEVPPVVPPAASDEKDDLTVVEGIGPKIQELLYQYGIRSYRQLAETDVARLKEILSEAGPQLAMHDPGTWPSQANLAANDQWDALKSIQGFLKGGKKPT